MVYFDVENYFYCFSLNTLCLFIRTLSRYDDIRAAELERMEREDENFVKAVFSKEGDVKVGKQTQVSNGIRQWPIN